MISGIIYIPFQKSGVSHQFEGDSDEVQKPSLDLTSLVCFQMISNIPHIYIYHAGKERGSIAPPGRIKRMLLSLFV